MGQVGLKTMYIECLAQTQVAKVSAGVTAEKKIKHSRALSFCPSPQAALLISLLHAYLLLRKLYQTFYTARHHSTYITNLS